MKDMISILCAIHGTKGIESVRIREEGRSFIVYPPKPELVSELRHKIPYENILCDTSDHGDLFYNRELTNRIISKFPAWWSEDRVWELYTIFLLIDARVLERLLHLFLFSKGDLRDIMKMIIKYKNGEELDECKSIQ